MVMIDGRSKSIATGTNRTPSDQTHNETHRVALDLMGSGKSIKGPRQWVFIFGTGRSGSTSVLDMVNAIPGFFIAGENHGAMDVFLEMQQDISNFDSPLEAFSFSAHYHGTWHKEDFSKAVQAYTLALIGKFDEKTTHTVGFKEVNHSRAEELQFFADTFPGAKFIINTRRDTAGQSQAQDIFFDEETGLTEEQIEVNTQELEHWAADHPESSFLIQMEDFDLQHFNEMLTWLGVEGCEFTQVSHANAYGFFPSETAGINCSDGSTMAGS